MIIRLMRRKTTWCALAALAALTPAVYAQDTLHLPAKTGTVNGKRIVLVAGDSDFVPAAKLARREGMEAAKASEKAGTMTEDDLKRVEKDIQTATDASVKEVDQHTAHKEKEILTV